MDLEGQKHHHSISGYSFHIRAGAILWSSKKQHVVALSSTKAEYIVFIEYDIALDSDGSFLWPVYPIALRL